MLHPEKRLYAVQQQQMTEAAIQSRFTRDLYVSLGEPLAGGVWLVRILHKPFIAWLWGGCLLMACGGVLAVSDRRYRVGVRGMPASVAAGKPAAVSAA
ncbi:Cytochrome c-type biogenesis protein CcmF [compost metagenome]